MPFDLPDPSQFKKTYQVIPGPNMGLITPENLENIARAARKYDVPLMKVTSAQRLAFLGMDPANGEALFRELGQSKGPSKPKGIHYVQACPGQGYCKYGNRQSLALGDKLQQELMGMDLPAKTKVGISGCPMNCCESYLRDVGIFAKKKGWTLVFGGNGGGIPRIADVIATGLDDDQVISLARRCLEYYAAHARKLERTARLMERTDLALFKEHVAA